ncbi:MAG: Nif3-like dinuclear metal center hexameric protein [Cytophagales bacterium]|nr:Nif3-like dinuclear metal center hexameric protein [Cytophagales bacterium]
MNAISHQDILLALHQFAPPVYKETYDNIGLQIGDAKTITKGILTTLDVTESVVNEAINTDCNLIVAHHPIIFKDIKKIDASTYNGRVISQCIKNDIAVIASHTNLDNIKLGVNYKIAQKIGLQNLKILQPKTDILYRLTIYVPVNETEKILSAVHAAGAGHIGNYELCSFRLSGTGTFKPNHEANPTIGKKEILEYVNEHQVDVLVAAPDIQNVLQAMRKAHPYEEIAYYLHPLANAHQEVGSGMIGNLPETMSCDNFMEQLMQKFALKCIKHTSKNIDNISKIAICGGSGSFLLYTAIAQKADVFITSDIKYHEYFDADGNIILVDIGHYESEQFTKELLAEVLLKKFPNIAVLLSKVNTNPVQYKLWNKA